MTSLRTLGAVWAALTIATIGSYWIGTHHAAAAGAAAAGGVVLVGFGKAWLVGRWFMETRVVPFALARAFDLWIGLSAATVISMVVLGTS